MSVVILIDICIQLKHISNNYINAVVLCLNIEPGLRQFSSFFHAHPRAGLKITRVGSIEPTISGILSPVIVDSQFRLDVVHSVRTNRRSTDCVTKRNKRYLTALRHRTRQSDILVSRLNINVFVSPVSQCNQT